MAKKKYSAPEFEAEMFLDGNIILTSGPNGSLEDGDNKGEIDDEF